MTVRPATDDDLDAIRGVAERSWAVDYPGILTRETAEQAVDDWYAPERLAAELDRTRSLLLVAEDGETLVGFAHATWSAPGDEGHILRIYVRPDHRREGVGRELLERTCAELAAHDVDRVNAMVLSENDRGNAFYERFGFELADRRETTIAGDSYRENRYVLEEFPGGAAD